jgi:DNA-binding transcriptional ArsR family regulator
MLVERTVDNSAAAIAAAIGEPARARMLYCLLDGHARTSTELAVVAEVSPSTTSVHLARLAKHQLVEVLSQGRHRYYSLAGANVAKALEALLVVAGGARGTFAASTPGYLRSARTCYDHMAGHIAVLLRGRFESLAWLSPGDLREDDYEVTAKGAKALASLGVDVDAARALRRRFAFACVDWSERCPHIGGSLGNALLVTALRQKWFVQDLDSRALRLTSLGRRQMQAKFAIEI